MVSVSSGAASESRAADEMVEWAVGVLSEYSGSWESFGRWMGGRPKRWKPKRVTVRDDPIFFFLFVVRPGFECSDILSVSTASSSFESSRGHRQDEQDEKRAIVKAQGVFSRSFRFLSYRKVLIKCIFTTTNA